MVVVAETSAADLLDVLGAAGAFPIIETPWADAPAAIAEIQPVALAIADPNGKPSARHTSALTQCIATRGGPIMPVIALVERDGTPAIPGALPIALDDSTDRLVARLRSALRIRTMHATVLRRARAIEANKQIAVPANLLADATVLCVGRGGSYPMLSVAIGERVGVIGAFSIETAMRYLNAREIDGVVIGDGLGARVVDALLAACARHGKAPGFSAGGCGISFSVIMKLENSTRRRFPHSCAQSAEDGKSTTQDTTPRASGGIQQEISRQIWSANENSRGVCRRNRGSI
jgi:hypothetical protein